MAENKSEGMFSGEVDIRLRSEAFRHKFNCGRSGSLCSLLVDLQSILLLYFMITTNRKESIKPNLQAKLVLKPGYPKRGSVRRIFEGSAPPLRFLGAIVTIYELQYAKNRPIAPKKRLTNPNVVRGPSYHQSQFQSPRTRIISAADCIVSFAPTLVHETNRQCLKKSWREKSLKQGRKRTKKWIRKLLTIPHFRSKKLTNKDQSRKQGSK